MLCSRILGGRGGLVERGGKAPPAWNQVRGLLLFLNLGDLRVTIKDGLHPNEVIEAMVIFGARTVIIGDR